MPSEIPGLPVDVSFGHAEAEPPDWRAETEDIEDPVEADEPDSHKDVLESLYGYGDEWWEEEKAVQNADVTEQYGEPPHDYSCLMFRLGGDLAFKVRQLGERISSEDLAEKGIESDPHITLKYGLHTNELGDVGWLAGEEPIAIQFGKCSFFEAPGHDVIKIDVHSQGLHRLHHLVNEKMPHTDTYPEYKPHITIAYVKPGLGKHYVDRLNDLEGEVVAFKQLTFSDKQRLHNPIELRGNAQFKEDAPSAPFCDVMQFAEQNENVERLRKFIQRGATSHIKRTVERLQKLKSSPYAIPTLMSEIRREVEALRPVLSDQLAAGMYSGSVESLADVVKSTPTSVDKPPPPPPTAAEVVFPGGTPSHVEFPTLESALNTLRKAPAAAGIDYRDTAAKVRAGAFAITGDLTDKAVGEIQEVFSDALAHGFTRQEFVEAVEKKMGSGVLSDAHLETVFRSNIQSSMSDAKLKAVSLPLVADAFPYAAVWITRDERTREKHKLIAKLGLNGTNVYRVDDPTFQKFRGPWEWNCRCGWSPVTVEQAARMGVSEAVQWLDRAKERATKEGGSFNEYLHLTAPQVPEHVTPPDFDPPPEFRRT